eukprot:Seg2728.2 transcript_id=Seg2728.2/GoldUCD/mRNA.D3Y31 product="Conserved oligomeric Golgi complex subunit 3" protein_id=Seg2728.2/GoldUCD/D3Y31
MEEDQEYTYREHRDELNEYCSKCDAILDEIHWLLAGLEELQRNYTFVLTQTRALHDACEQSIQEQANLTGQVEGITERLMYFSTLETIKHKMTGTTLSVTGESFVPLLTRIDECISYMEKNAHYKEAPVYLIRFKQCLNQALGMLKQLVFKILRNSTEQASASLQKDHEQAQEGSFTAMYGKFKTQAFRVKNIMEQVEPKLESHPEYESFIQDCQQNYFECRGQILQPYVYSTIQKLAKQHTRNQCTLFRSGCSFLVHVCQDEYQLYFEFFTKKSEGLDLLLEVFCNSLYETFRPLIIHMTHMETLAEICNILQVEMLEEHIARKADQLSAFEVIISQLLEDVQERLVYKAQTYIRNDIESYKPAAGDLAYPDKLMVEASSVMENNEEGKETKPYSTVAMVDQQAMWYPTVRRTLVCLSKLYNCIAKTTFEGIAQEALSICIGTLKSASKSITERKGAINGHLFFIKHLLILREQIAPFDVDFAIKEVALDFSKMKTAAFGLLSKGTRLLSLSSNNAILEFLLEGVPQLTEYCLDSKKEVDNQLKDVCEQFITTAVESFINPLGSFLDKIDTLSKLAEEEGKEKRQLVGQQPFAKPESVRKIVSEAYMLLKSKLPGVMESMALYLASKETEYILFKPIKTKVLKVYRQLSQLVQENYGIEDQQIIGCPSQEQVSLLMAFH